MDSCVLGVFEVLIVRLFYSKAGVLCQFFRGIKIHDGNREILCYNLPQSKRRYTI